jgi:hypothetical protein
VRAYYNHSLATGIDLPVESIHSLHDLYRGVLGAYMSKDLQKKVGMVQKMLGLLRARYGTIGADTVKFFFNNEVMRPHFSSAHQPETYFAAMKSLTEAQLKQPRKIIQGIANCPVDITILDEEGTVAWLYVDAHTGIPNCFHIFADDIAYIGEPGVEPVYN